ncbi:MAG: hypothetical protein EPO40_32555 [Myxococcaceae bacterium]|nr:MAG: hypothetical protein EPO40_32555 [Myxococcaceae bacterium]
MPGRSSPRSPSTAPRPRRKPWRRAWSRPPARRCCRSARGPPARTSRTRLAGGPARGSIPTRPPCAASRRGALPWRRSARAGGGWRAGTGSRPTRSRGSP